MSHRFFISLFYIIVLVTVTVRKRIFISDIFLHDDDSILPFFCVCVGTVWFPSTKGRWQRRRFFWKLFALVLESLWSNNDSKKVYCVCASLFSFFFLVSLVSTCFYVFLLLSAKPKTPSKLLCAESLLMSFSFLWYIFFFTTFTAQTKNKISAEQNNISSILWGVWPIIFFFQFGFWSPCWKEFSFLLSSDHSLS